MKLHSEIRRLLLKSIYAAKLTYKNSLEIECEKCSNKNFYILPEYEVINNAIRKNLWLNIKCYSCDNFNILIPATLETKPVYDSYQYQSGGAYPGGVKFI